MAQSPPTALTALQDRFRPAFRYRWPAVPVLLATLVVAIAGLAIPVDTSVGTSGPASRWTALPTRGTMDGNCSNQPNPTRRIDMSIHATGPIV